MREALNSDDDDSEFEDAPKFHLPKKARRGSANRKTAVTTKTARAHAKAYRPGPPIVPQLIVNKLLEYVQRVSLSKRQLFIERLCRYWSLKREARRGAPLLKRLHLEVSYGLHVLKTVADATALDSISSSQTPNRGGEGSQAEGQCMHPLCPRNRSDEQFLTMLRNDLDKVRMLAELTRKREREKLRQAQVIKDIVDSFLFPHDNGLRLILEKISA